MNLIASVDENWAIGCQGQLLFQVPEDMRWFKQHTLNKVVVMGRATLISLPGSKALPKRTNIVLSHDETFSVPGCQVVHSLEQLFTSLAAYANEDVFVIGGASLYQTLLPYCQLAYITKFKATVAADRYLPNLDEEPLWQLLEQSAPHSHEQLQFSFCTYSNSKPLAW